MWWGTQAERVHPGQGAEAEHSLQEKNQRTGSKDYTNSLLKGKGSLLPLALNSILTPFAWKSKQTGISSPSE